MMSLPASASTLNLLSSTQESNPSILAGAQMESRTNAPLQAPDLGGWHLVDLTGSPPRLRAFSACSFLLDLTIGVFG